MDNLGERFHNLDDCRLRSAIHNESLSLRPNFNIHGLSALLRIYLLYIYYISLGTINPEVRSFPFN